MVSTLAHSVRLAFSGNKSYCAKLSRFLHLFVDNIVPRDDNKDELMRIMSPIPARSRQAFRRAHAETPRMHVHSQQIDVVKAGNYYAGHHTAPGHTRYGHKPPHATIFERSAGSEC